MNCTICGTKMRVRDTRMSDVGVRYRRYVCPGCTRVSVTRWTAEKIIDTDKDLGFQIFRQDYSNTVRKRFKGD